MQDAMAVMGLSEDEANNLFKTIAAVLHFGNMQFSQSKRSEFADGVANNVGEVVAHLLGLNAVELSKALLRPRIKVGNEYTTQGRSLEQVHTRAFILSC
jgi:myosin heavy subunit